MDIYSHEKGGSGIHPREIVASVTAIANLLAQSMSTEALDYWGAILSQLGTTMTTLAELQEARESGDQPESAPLSRIGR